MHIGYWWESQRPLGRLRRRSVDNIRIHLRETESFPIHQSSIVWHYVVSILKGTLDSPHKKKKHLKRLTKTLWTEKCIFLDLN
jgi:hypothetical protein